MMSSASRLTMFMCCLAASGVSEATTYYVANSGDDSNVGTAAMTPWKTVAKVNVTSLQPGDSVLFKRGDRFQETLVPSSSGTAALPVSFGAYGTGAKPLFSAFQTLSNWTSAGSNIWQAVVPGAATHVSGVVIGSVLQPLSRYPRATATNGGYRTFSSHTSQAGVASISDAALPATPDFSDGEIFIRTNHWLVFRGPISAHVGSTITFPYATGNEPLTDGYGYFVQNSRAALAATGDWSFNLPQHSLSLFNPVMPSAVQVPVLERLVSIDSKNYLEFSELAFEGSNAETIYARNASFVAVRQCTIDFAGTYAVFMAPASNVVVDGNIIRQSLSEGVSIESILASGGAVVTNNLITDTGIIAGMGLSGQLARNTAINVRVGTHATIERNTISRTGYLPIAFYGSDISIKNNVIDSFCSVMDDGAGIYTWNGSKANSVNRSIVSNVISNGIGAAAGTLELTSQAYGVYFDLDSINVEMTGNTISAVANDAVQANSPQFVTVHDNTFFNNGGGWSLSRWVDDQSIGYPGQDIANLDVHDNLFVNKTAEQNLMHYLDQGLNFPATSTMYARLSSIGTFDRNKFYSPNRLPFSMYYRNDKTSPYVYPPNESLDQWRLTSGLERTSTMLPTQPAYVINSLVGANQVPAGTFERASDLNSISLGSTPATWDQTGQLSGAGALKVSLVTPQPTINTFVSMAGAVGPVDASRKYIFRISTRGTTEHGLLRLILKHAGGSPISAAQKRPFGTARVDHEFLIDDTTTDPSAAWQLDILEASGTTYVDDISFFEVDAALTNPDDFLQFEVNPSDTPRTVTVSRNSVDARGVPACGMTTLAPFSSIVLFKSSVLCSVSDAGLSDAGLFDAGVLDAGPADAGFPDSGLADAGTDQSDAGEEGDAGPMTLSPVKGGCQCNSTGASDAAALIITLLMLRRRTPRL